MSDDTPRLFTDHAIETGEAGMLRFAIGRAILGFIVDLSQAKAKGDVPYAVSLQGHIDEFTARRDRIEAEVDAFEATRERERLEAKRYDDIVGAAYLPTRQP